MVEKQLKHKQANPHQSTHKAEPHVSQRGLEKAVQGLHQQINEYEFAGMHHLSGLL